MGKISYFTLRALSCTLLMSVALFAEEDMPSDGDHIKPGSRPMAHTEWMKIQEERQKEEEVLTTNPEAIPEEEKVDQQEPTELAAKLGKNGINAGVNLPNAKTGIHYTSHQGAFYSPVAISPLGETVEFNDGSIWTISSGDTYKTLNWLTSDLLVVTPNHSWFSNYMFCITNQNTAVSVKANLLLGPIYNGIFTHWIVAINYYSQEICLEDGSVWKLCGLDSSVFNKWLLNDTVLIGINDGFFSSSKPNILINVNTLSYARAKCTW